MEISNKYNGFYSVDEISIESKSGKLIKREIVSTGGKSNGSVAALVYNTKTDKYIFVSQWRPGPKSSIIEIVAGLRDYRGEDPKDTIIREIEEEVGYKTDTLILLEECFMSPGALTERISIYYAEVSEKIGNGGGVESEDEDIEIVEMSPSKVLTEKFNDAKTIIAVNYIKNKLT